jgi:hypothetical protein
MPSPCDYVGQTVCIAAAETVVMVKIVLQLFSKSYGKVDQLIVVEPCRDRTCDPQITIDLCCSFLLNVTVPCMVTFSLNSYLVT